MKKTRTPEMFVLNRKTDHGTIKARTDDQIKIEGEIVTNLFGTQVHYKDIHTLKIINVYDAKGRSIEGASIDILMITHMQSQ